MTYPDRPVRTGTDEAETSTAATEADAWRQPGAWTVPAPPWAPQGGTSERPAARGADDLPQPARGASPPGDWPGQPIGQSYSLPVPAGGSGTSARPAVVVTGVVLAALLLVLGGLILIRTQDSHHAGLGSSGRPTAPRVGPPGVGPPGVNAPGPAQTAGKYVAVYEVTGAGEAHVLYTVTEGNTVAMMPKVTLPWRTTAHLDADVGEVTLRAITEGDPPDGFGCKLVVGADTVTDTTPDEVGAVMCQIQIRSRPGDGLVPPANPEGVV